MATVYKFQLLHYIAASLSLAELCGNCWLGLHVSAEPRASGLSAGRCGQDRLPSLLFLPGGLHTSGGKSSSCPACGGHCREKGCGSVSAEHCE